MPAYRSVEIRAAKLGNRAGLPGAPRLARRLVLGNNPADGGSTFSKMIPYKLFSLRKRAG